MLTMDQIHDIRFRFYEKGENVSEIAAAMHLDWRTVRKYIDQNDFNDPAPKPVVDKKFCPKLDPYKADINEWLIDDKSAPRKQRHTAKRVFQRLLAEVPGFDCSYRTVAAYYAVKHREIFKQNKDAYLPLVHRPGEAQVDFGTAEFYENGLKLTGKYLEVSFPYSNKGYLQLFYGENMECLLEGLDAIFRHICVVPEELWFDNTKVIVTEIIHGGGRKLTDKFERFREHYRFKAVFMNPGAGHEKGNVENKVGYQRRNFMVPVPRFLSLSEYNRQLLSECEKDANREHYRHNETIEERFQADLKACHELPVIAFDLNGHQTLKADNWAKVYLNKKQHAYSVAPKYAQCPVHLVLTSSLVIIQDENFREIIRHRRLYGDTRQEQMDWLPYLKQLSLRPRALKYSGIYEMMPESMQTYLASCSSSEVGQILKLLSELTGRTGFDSAVNTVNHAITYRVKDADSLSNLYRRLYSDIPELPAMTLNLGIPQMKVMQPNLTAYDALLKRTGADCHVG
ncbi:IS21 family transposase [Acetobacterium fimetarium]|uniref:IS21 family transposase n=2 Tax=Acetobacterium fimetarium TaxID=52691 RepID=A0ABR6WUG2_9FIRM|nr:IS21 family transposase [Acetobacterium fimetarium]MBC3804258.1 IS21 family transposase [Acetobacterium fimetarium]